MSIPNATQSLVVSAIAQSSPRRVEHRLWSSFLAWSLFVLLMFTAVEGLSPPAPLPASAPENSFSAERAMAHVRAIARTAHPIGSDANQEVRHYLLAQLASLGLSPMTYESTGTRNDAYGLAFARTYDIIARLPGRASSGAMMLMAHYDSVRVGSGAADDAAGVSAVLESVRALRSGPRLRNDLIVLFTDGEEPGQLGADAFAATHPWSHDVRFLLNFEARGNRGASLIFETSPHNARLMDIVSRSASHAIGSSLFYSIYRLLPNNTDFSVFRNKAAVSGLNFAFGENLDGYHSRLDDALNLSTASLQHQGSYALDLARAFGQSDLTRFVTGRQDDVFFDWYGDHLIVYPYDWVIPAQVLLSIVLLCALVAASRRGGLRVSRLPPALLRCLAILLGVPIALSIAGLVLLKAFAGRAIGSDTPAALWLFLGLLWLGLSMSSGWFVWAGRRSSIDELTPSGLILGCALSWMLSLELPGGSYLLYWPLLLGAVGYLVSAIFNGTPGTARRFFLCLPGAAAAIALFAPIAYLIYVFLTLQIPAVVVLGLFVGLFSIIAVPFLNAAAAGAKVWRVVSILLALSGISIGTAALRSQYTAEHPRRDHIAYNLNADTGSAQWMSIDPSTDAWTARMLSHDPLRSNGPPLCLPSLQLPILSAAAHSYPLAAPRAEVVADDHRPGKRTLLVHIVPRQNAEEVVLTFAGNVQLLRAMVDTRDIVPTQKSGLLAIRLFGRGISDSMLTLTVNAPAGAAFWLTDEAPGLPIDVGPRPDYLMPRDGSDTTAVCRKYQL